MKMNKQYLDQVLLDELRSILEDEFPVVVATYLQDSSLRVHELQQAFDRGDTAAVRKVAHSLKGSSANLGLIYLAELCCALEDAAREGSLAGQEANMILIRQEQEHATVLLHERV